jgi:hypothetical protein
VNIMVQQILFQHFSSGDEEVALTSLTAELERVLREYLRRDTVTSRCLDIRNNRYLAVPFDALDESYEIVGGTKAWELRIRGNSHICFERNVLLEQDESYASSCDEPGHTNNIAAAICTWLSGPKIVTTSEAVSLSGKRTCEFVLVSMS